MTTRCLTAGLLAAVVLPVASCQPKGAPPALAPTPTAPTIPTFKYVAEKEHGCGNTFLFKGAADGREVLWIHALNSKEPAAGTRTFDVSVLTREIEVGVDLWDKDGSWWYCQAVLITADDKKATWKAKKGQVTITISDVRPRERGGLTYKASARIEGVVFEDGAGKQATLELETINATVVWGTN